MELEPNDTPAQATPASAPAAFNGRIQTAGDVDYYKFTATKGQVLQVELFGRRLRSPIDSVIYVCNKDGGRLVGDDDARRPDSFLKYTIPNDGEYLVEVRDHLMNGGPSFSYRVEIEPAAPHVVAGTVEFERYVQPQFVVPQNGGRGVVLNVQRSDFGGPINWRGEDLPPGVRVECPEGWRADATMPLVLYAAADAPIGGKWSRIGVYADDPKQPNLKVEGILKQDIMMIRGQNNTIVWQEDLDRMPVVVTQAAPFRVRIEVPKVPLVQAGSMNLKVIAERDGDFKAPIQLRVLANPPGCNANGSIAIAEGQTEALIPINAAGNAAVRESYITVRAFAQVGNGIVETCSPFVPLKVEEAYLKFKFEQAAVEQGKETPLLIKVEKRKDWEGEAIVTLLALPANATAEPIKLTKDQTEFSFTVKTAANTPPGDNKNLVCQVLVPESGDQIAHSMGTGRLRVDAPPPPKPNDPPPMPAATPMPMPVAVAPPKPLSRLEQLRLQQKMKDEAKK